MNTEQKLAQRDELLQVALDFIGTLTGMCPPPIEVAPPEVFAPFYAFVDRVQAIAATQPQTDALDTERLDFLTRKIGGAAFRKIGVEWAEHADARRAIDAAIAAGKGE